MLLPHDLPYEKLLCSLSNISHIEIAKLYESIYPSLEPE